MDYKTSDQLHEVDLEWASDTFRQVQICRAEATALEQFMLSKITNKYNLQLQFGDQLDISTGKIVRAKLPQREANFNKDGIDESKVAGSITPKPELVADEKSNSKEEADKN